MFEAKYQWVPAKAVSSAAVEQLSKELNLAPLTTKLLLQRGITTQKEAEAFLNPTLEQLADPFALHDMQRAVERIKQAIASDEQITVYGDYDVDGISSTAVVYEALMDLGAKVNYYIPDRFKDGYGPNLQRYQQLIKNQTELLITVDNGVAGFAAIEFAQNQGVDVVITDHHALPPKLPPAYAIVHPRYPQHEYACPNLAGVGVAFKLVCALLDEIPQEMLDLVVLGTIADLVELTGENRALVKFGLQALQQTQRPGLIALANSAKLDLTQADAETISFGLAPRLNSLGRLATGQIGVELLTTFDEDQAAEIAAKVEKLNQKRQQETEKIATAAWNQLKTADQHLVNVVAGEGWNTGLVGIAASRLVEKSQRPTLVLGIDPVTKIAKGSGRSVAAFDLFAALDPQRQLFEAFGGHQQACGLTIKVSQLPELQKVLDAAAQQQHLDTAGKEKLEIAATLPLSSIDQNLIDQINLLQPFGPGNPAPTFSFTDYQLVQPKMIGKKQNHLQFRLQNAQQQVAAIDFFAGEQGTAFIKQPAAFKFVGHLTLNKWKNQVKPQIMVADLGSSGPLVIDRRTPKLSRQLFNRPATFFFFEQRHYSVLKPYFSADCNLVIGEKQLLQQKSFSELILVDCPPSLKEFAQLFAQLQVEQLEVIFYPFTIKAGVKVPTRAELARVYRYVLKHQQIKLAENLEPLANYLELKPQQLNFILQMFFEAGFVKIDKGLMTGCVSRKKIDLTKMVSYRSKLQQLKSEKILIQGKSADLTNWIARLLTN